MHRRTSARLVRDADRRGNLQGKFPNIAPPIATCIDLKTPAGKAVFLDLVRKADVVFDNFSVGVTERLGIDHAALALVNPRIVTCSVTGFGHTGPYRERPGYDFMIQGMAGLMSVTGERDDLPGGGPQKAGIPIADTDISITDVDNTTLTSATITLTNPQLGDVLTVGTLPAGITATVIGNVVTLSGSSSLANYQSAIRAITYASTSENPSTPRRRVIVQAAASRTMTPMSQSL